MTAARRPAAVAGRYYPADPDELAAAVAAILAPAAGTVRAGQDDQPAAPAPKAVVAPHAGYPWCAPVLGPPLRALAAGRGRIERVVVVGPAHRDPPAAIAVSGAAVWETPLGPVAVDRVTGRRLAALPDVRLDEGPHRREHSIEVLLPLLRTALGDVRVVPVAVGAVAPSAVGRLLDAAWGGDETAIVVSTDLAHGHDELTTRRCDAATVRALVEGRAGDVGPECACGWRAVAALVGAAGRRGLTARPLAVGTSADTVGDPRRAVGYAGIVYRALLPLVAADLATLGTAAARAIAPRLAGGPDVPDDALARDLAPAVAVRGPGAAFVRLTVDGEPRGCQGTVRPRRPLWRDVVAGARRAAFEDRRYPPLDAGAWRRAMLTVAVLSPLEEIPAFTPAAAAAALVPGADGLVVSAGGQGAVVLPHVWDRYGEGDRADAFVAGLVRKAGWAERWRPGARAWRFRVQEASWRCADVAPVVVASRPGPGHGGVRPRQEGDQDMAPISSTAGQTRHEDKASPLVNVRSEYTHETPDGDDEPADATSCDDG